MKICPNCKTENSNSSTFCEKCNTFLDNKVQNITDEVSPPPKASGLKKLFKRHKS